MAEKSNKKEVHPLESIGLAAWKIISGWTKISFHGLGYIPYKNFYFQIFVISQWSINHLFAFFNWDLYWLNKLLPWIFRAKWCYSMAAKPLWIHSMVLNLIFFFLLLFLFGLYKLYFRINSQRKMDRVSLSNGIGEKPIVIEEIDIPPLKKKIIINAPGISLDTMKGKAGEFISAYKAKIEDVDFNFDSGYFELFLSRYSFPTFLDYSEISNTPGLPYSFILGQTHMGPLQQLIDELPHLLVAGTTGMGKSIFCKQIFMRLLETSPNIQLYLLDLKYALEMTPFEGLPNVNVYSDLTKIVLFLRACVLEMRRRFTYMKDKKKTSINYAVDEMDKIIIGIDEASILYQKNSNKFEDKLRVEAACLTEELAKLSRAAGFSLVFSTQKLEKSAIGTGIQENIGGRVCFRAKTLQGSVAMLQTRHACDLPAIKGRGYWSFSDKLIEFQTPFISPEEITKRCQKIKSEFDLGLRKNFSRIIGQDQNLIVPETKKRPASIDTNMEVSP